MLEVDVALERVRAGVSCFCGFQHVYDSDEVGFDTEIEGGDVHEVLQRAIEWVKQQALRAGWEKRIPDAAEVTWAEVGSLRTWTSSYTVLRHGYETEHWCAIVVRLEIPEQDECAEGSCTR